MSRLPKAPNRMDRIADGWDEEGNPDYGSPAFPIYSIGRSPSGEWQVFVDHQRDPAATGFDTRDEAQEWIDEQEHPDGEA